MKTVFSLYYRKITSLTRGFTPEAEKIIQQLIIWLSMCYFGNFEKQENHPFVCLFYRFLLMAGIKKGVLTVCLPLFFP